MICRLHFLYASAPLTSALVAAIGILTAAFSASIALAQRDIKRTLAYSTISQLGYMFLATGVGAYSAAMFHLTTHAFFKALLFLGSGSVIHASGKQDVFAMGGLGRKLPSTRFVFWVGVWAISGLPIFSGFFSKDEILWRSLVGEALPGHLLWWLLGIGTAWMTAFYMWRVYYLAFEGETRMEAQEFEHLHESPPSMLYPMYVLALLSVLGGLLGLPHWVAEGANWAEIWLEPFWAHSATEPSGLAASMGLAVTLMLVSVLVACAGWWYAYLNYKAEPDRYKQLAARFPRLHQLLVDKWRVEEAVYFPYVVWPLHRFSERVYSDFDLKVVDGAVNGVGWLMASIGGLLRYVQTSKLRNYALGVLVGAVVLVAAFLYQWFR